MNGEKLYIYLFQDGRVRKSRSAPDAEQRASIADGSLRALMLHVHPGFPDDPWLVQPDGDIEEIPMI